MADERRTGSGSQHSERGWERRLGGERRQAERRRRAVLVEVDRRSGGDRRKGERRAGWPP